MYIIQKELLQYKTILCIYSEVINLIFLGNIYFMILNIIQFSTYLIVLIESYLIIGSKLQLQ